jgi:hypothetical protein
MPPGNSRSAVVTVNPPGQWTNQHKNVVQAYDRLYDVWNPPTPNTDFLGDLQLTVAALQGIIRDAIRDNISLRALGGGWSLSRAAVTDGRLVNTTPLNWYFPVAAAGVSPAYTGDSALLMYLQCGVSVDEANGLLFQQPRPLALKTSGASNGQTIAGAVSTGTHGARFGFGAMPDYVVGLHLITAPDRAIWLERASYPVLSDHLIARLGAQLVRDDTMFNAALVSFGSFGLVHGVMIEAEPLYLLEASRRRISIDGQLKRAMQTLDFSAIPMPYADEEPLHFEVVINPHDTSGGAYVTTMYQRPYRNDYPRPTSSPAGLGPGDDVLAVVGKLGDTLPAVVGPLVNAVIGTEYRPYAQQWGTPGEIFSSTATLQKAMSAELGVSLADAVRVLDLMLAAPEVRGYAGVLAFRYVKRSRALLAFTKFDITCTIELPAAFADRTLSYYNAVWQGLEDAGIPYTLHWGQMHNFTPARVRRMYGAAVDDWIASRNALLAPQVQAIFTSPFLRQCGLA